MTIRKPHQKKPIKKEHKSQRGVAEIYDEKKKPTSYGLTPFGKSSIDKQAASYHVSASQYIEMIGRENFKVVSVEQFALIKELIHEVSKVASESSQDKNLNKAFLIASQLLLSSVFILQMPFFILSILLLFKSYSS